VGDLTRHHAPAPDRHAEPLSARLRRRRVVAWAWRPLGRLASGLAAARARARRLARRIRYRRLIEQMHLAVCTPCQYDCVSCAHQGMRYQFPNHHLSLGELRAFLATTESSGYFIERLQISGPGEPLLWKHLSEGLELLGRSPAIGFIEVLSNGVGINRLDERAWQNIDLLRVSLYPEAAHIEPLLARAKVRYGEARIIVKGTRSFRAAPAAAAPRAIPCECTCTGPMYFDGRVLLFCGPPVFDAAAAVGRDLFDYPEMFRPLQPDYLSSGAPSRTATWPLALAPVDSVTKVGNHELCRYCFANSPASRSRHPHSAFRPAKASGN
jgi:hypothetical protein